MKKITSYFFRRRLGHRGVWPAFFSALTLLVFLQSPCLANTNDEAGPSLYLGLWTKHLNPSSDTNENSGLFGIGYQDYILTVFQNSYGQTTVFPSKRFHTRRFWYDDSVGLFLQGNLYLGIFYGYTHDVPNVGGFTPGLMPTVGVGYRYASLELLYFPTPKGGFFLSFLSFRFGKNSERVEPVGTVNRKTDPRTYPSATIWNPFPSRQP